jgi:hypothetical protein
LGGGANKKLSGADKKVWLFLDGPQRIAEVISLSPYRVILPLTPDNVRERARKRHREKDPRVVWSLPPLLFSREAAKAKTLLGTLMRKGDSEFMVATLGELELLQSLGKGLRIHGDHRLGFLNHLGAESLFGLGFASATISLEADKETFELLGRRPFQGKVLIYLSGRPPLFTSRLTPALKRGPVESLRGEKYYPSKEGEAFVLLPEKRVFMGGLLLGPSFGNFGGFVVDLRREKKALELGRAILRSVYGGKPLGGTAFNYRRGLL